MNESMLNFYLGKLTQLNGYTVKNPVKTGDGQFFGLLLKKKGSPDKVVWFLQDDEGNGPGSFEIN